MAQLAIRGHATRGKEVIEILEMLGGKQFESYNGTDFNWCYTIIGGSIDWDFPSDKYKVFSLEEFLEKFPCKVGDKVCFCDSPAHYLTIKKMWWNDKCNDLECTFNEDDIDVSVKDLQLYKADKEETMEEGTLVQIDLTRELCVADEVEVILGDYEFVLKDGKTYFIKKKPQYPKTYKECCDALGLNTMDNDAQGYKSDLIIRFQELLIARDAYWKIAGEQMGLSESWKPDWEKLDERKYCITNTEGNVAKWIQQTTNKILAFPTEEMQDVFYENFNELIESCKELL